MFRTDQESRTEAGWDILGTSSQSYQSDAKIGSSPPRSPRSGTWNLSSTSLSLTPTCSASPSLADFVSLECTHFSASCCYHPPLKHHHLSWRPLQQLPMGLPQPPLPHQAIPPLAGPLLTTRTHLKAPKPPHCPRSRTKALSYPITHRMVWPCRQPWHARYFCFRAALAILASLQVRELTMHLPMGCSFDGISSCPALPSTLCLSNAGSWLLPRGPSGINQVSSLIKCSHGAPPCRSQPLSSCDSITMSVIVDHCPCPRLACKLHEVRRLLCLVLHRVCSTSRGKWHTGLSAFL